MKNFFRINVKTQEKAYAPHIVRSVCSETSLQHEASDAEMLKTQKASKLPLWLRIIQLLCFLTAVCIFGGLLDAIADSIGEESFGSMWERFVGNGVIALIVVGAVCLAVFVALLVWGRIRYKNVLSSPDYKSVIDNRETLQNSSYEELGVPTDADEINILSFPFKLNRKGKEVAGNPFATYATVSVKIFKQDDNLYIADTSDLIKIPFAAVTAANYIPKSINFSGWNKPQNINSKEYKQYKIRAYNFGTLFMKGYISVGLLFDGEESEIIIPLYEQDVIEKYIPVSYTVK